MIRNTDLTAARRVGLAISLLTIAACAAGGSGSTADAPCTECGPTFAPERPPSAVPGDAPRLDVTVPGESARPMSAALDGSTIRVRRGADATIEVRVDRAGFTGELAVWAEGLPSGLVVEPAVMPSTVPTGRVVLAATESAAVGGPFAFTLLVAAAGDDDPIAVPARVVVAGAPGTLDESFGEDGVAAVHGRRVSVLAAAVDTRGRVVLSGRDRDDQTMFLERLGVTGALDEAYGDAAQVVLPDEEFSSGSRLVLEGDEARVLMTAGRFDEERVQVGLVVLDADGHPDTTVGGTGVIAANRIPVRGPTSFVMTQAAGTTFFRVGERLAALRPGGEVVELALPSGAPTARTMAYWNHTLTFGTASDAGGTMLERVHTAGGRDERFGQSGAVRASDGEDAHLRATFGLALGADGSGYAGSNVLFFDDAYFGELTRFTADGTPDPSFGEGGRVLFAAEGDHLQALALDRAALPVVLTVGEGSKHLRRYTERGVIDHDFGPVDLVALGLGHAQRMAHDAVADRVVVCGGDDHQWSCARFWL